MRSCRSEPCRTAHSVHPHTQHEHTTAHRATESKVVVVVVRARQVRRARDPTQPHPHSRSHTASYCYLPLQIHYHSQPRHTSERATPIEQLLLLPPPHIFGTSDSLPHRDYGRRHTLSMSSEQIPTEPVR
ncbi:hypothetical protein BJY59DRAFT_600090 [Rhodotorula toruloides]